MAPSSTRPTPDDLRRWRERQGMTQAEAERWWFGHSNDGRTWRRWESGERRIPPPLAKRIRGR